MYQERTNTLEEVRGTDRARGLSSLAGRDLTSREREIWLLMAAGCSDIDIAQRLSLNMLTVRVCMSNAFLKLGVSSRQEAATLARQSGAPCEARRTPAVLRG